MKGWLPPSLLFGLALAGASGGCSVEASPANPATAADGGAKAGARKAAGPDAQTAPDAGGRPQASSPEKGDDDDDVPIAPSKTIVGMTRAQVRARLGRPTKIRGNEWIYTPDQEGCRDVILSDVVTFKNDVVAGVRKDRRQTGKICGMRRR